mgnify:FL=1
MKVIVNKMPEKPVDCVFSEQYIEIWLCKLGKEGDWCDIKNCPCLLEMDDYLRKNKIG